MKFEVRWTTTALDELERIAHHIERESPQAAVDLVNSAFDRGDELVGQPRLGPMWEPGRKRSIRKLQLRPYRLFYIVDDGRGIVFVVAFRDSRRRDPRVDEILK